MHSSLLLLTLVSLVLIAAMVTCFYCLVKRRRREQEELERQVASSTNGPQTSIVEFSPSKEAMLNNNELSSKSKLQQQLRASPHSTASTSPYHTSHAPMVMQQAEQVTNSQTEIRSDMTQQINAAIIGSSEAEFQNDFIQVFPMYQIEPQPDKNTTPYLN